ncbi:ribonuclease H-like domain-containing protein [Tanacetum coccineum]
MQKVVLKQQFEAFTISSLEGLEKGYDRFQQLLSQLEAHGAEVSTEDANHKFLRSLPPAWSNLAMTMRTKPDVDTLSLDDFKSNTNKVKSGHTCAYKDLDLLHEDLKQIDDVDIEEMDINWQIAMIAIRMKKFYKKTGRRVRIDGNKPVGFDKKKLECFKCHNTVHFARECPSKGTNDGKKRDSFYQDQGAGKKKQNQNYLLTMDDGVSLSFVLKLHDSYNKLKTLCDEQTNQLGEQEAKILAYTLAVKKLEAQVVTFQKHRFSKTDNFKGVPHSLTGDYTPKPQEEIDDSLYVYGKKEPQKPEISDSDDNSAEHSTCQSNDSEGSFGNPSEHSFESESKSISVPNEMSASNLSYLIKDCDYYEKKMAREAKLKKQRVFNTDNGVAKSVWNNAHRVNHANHFVPRPVQLNAVRTNVNTGRSKQPVPTCNSNSFSPVRPQGNWGTAVKTSAGYNWRRTRPNSNYNSGSNFVRTDHPLKNMEDRGIFDSGCSGHMTGNKDHLDDFEECKGGSVTFGGSKGYITGKGRIRVGNLDFDSVSFVKELGHFNLFSISQICDKHHKVLFTETECLVVSPDFKMPDENQILLKVPRQHNMYSFDMKTPSLTKDYACLIAKATSDESKLWHRRLGHINFKNLNKLVKGNLVRGLPSKVFRNDHTCVACQKDNDSEFKNRDMLEFCGNKGIKQEYSNARTPQQNGVAERMNRTLIKAARTMLADSLLPTTFWAEAVSTACYIFNRVRVTKPQNKTPYELLFGHKPIISYIRPFGCHVTILDTLSVLGKFDGKCDEGFLVGYSLNSKAFRVYNLVTKKVEVNMHVKFLEEKPNVKGVGYRWMFDIDYLTDSMNYIHVSLENQTNPHAGTSEVTNNACALQTPNANVSEEEDDAEEIIVVPASVKHTAAYKLDYGCLLHNSRQGFLTELQNLKTQENEAYSTGISEDTPEILANKQFSSKRFWTYMWQT